MAFSASDWYWSGTPGLYGSARGGLVANPAADAPYQAWLAFGRAPTAWPQDEAGAQTAPALDVVLTANGLPPTGIAPAAAKAWLNAYAWAAAQRLLATTRAYAVAGAGSIACAAGPAQADLTSIMIWGQANPAATQAWTDDDYAVFILTGAQAAAFALAVLAYGQGVYATLASAAAGIASGALASAAAIDALAWPS